MKDSKQIGLSEFMNKAFFLNFSVLLLSSLLGPLTMAQQALAKATSNSFSASANEAAALSRSVNEQAIRAIEKSNLKKLSELIASKKIAIDQVVQGHDSLLLVAVSLQKPEVIKFLLKQKADVNFKNAAGETPLLVAVASSDNQSAKLLIESGAKLMERSGETEDSALHLAAVNDNVDLVKIILKQNPESISQLNSAHESALHKAAYFGALRVIPVLLQAGADLNQKDKAGLTALDVARKNKLTAAQRLLKAK